MKFTLVLAGLLVLVSADASALSERERALAECRAQAQAMNHVPKTVKWNNSVKDCMVDRGFNGG